MEKASFKTLRRLWRFKLARKIAEAVADEMAAEYRAAWLERGVPEDKIVKRLAKRREDDIAGALLAMLDEREMSDDQIASQAREYGIPVPRRPRPIHIVK